MSQKTDISYLTSFIKKNLMSHCPIFALLRKKHQESRTKSVGYNL